MQVTDRELLELILKKVTNLEDRMTSLENRVTGLENRMTGVEHEMVGIRGTLDEHTQLLKALESRTDIMSVNIVKTQEDLAYLTGKVEGIITEVKTIKEYADFHTFKIGLLERELFHLKNAG